MFAGAFHDFHQAWAAEIRSTLNGWVLPDGYYVAIEPIAGGPETDVITLESERAKHESRQQDWATAVTVACICW